jgi:hypothetical protein
MLGKTTTKKEEGLFQAGSYARTNRNFTAGVAYAYSSDVESGETRRFKSALTISRNATFRLDEINAY